MDWRSFVIAFAGLLVAGLSLWLNFKSRTSAYRELLYRNQFDGYAELVERLASIFDVAARFLADHQWRLDDTTRPQFAHQVEPQVRTLNLGGYRYAVFMPKKVADEIFRFLGVLLALSASEETAGRYPKEIVYADDHGKVLQEAFEKVIEATREALGTEPLSQETLRMIGGPRR